MITRNNYEELFLLYVDNELSAAEKAAVEQFVGDNPDLGAELTQLKQSVLHPEDGLFFSNKESLLRDPTGVDSDLEGSLLRGELPVWAGESSFIEEGNYPVYLLSYLDNELDKESRKIVDNHLAQHPRLEEELAVLRQTRPEPDLSIVFDGKDLLYKQEYSNRNAILSWSRVAAAILLLVAGLLLFDKTKQRIRRGDSTDSPIAGNSSRYKNPKDLKNENSEKNEKDQRDIKNINGKKVFQKDSQAVTPHAVDPLYKKEDIGIRIQKSKKIPIGTPAILAQQQQTEADSAVVTRRPNRVPDSLLLTRTTKPPTGETIREVLREATVTDNKDNAIAKNNTVILASEGIPIEDPSANKKNKLRGLFRKVTRVLGKATNADNDDNDNNKHGVLIGSFQVAL